MHPHTCMKAGCRIPAYQNWKWSSNEGVSTCATLAGQGNRAQGCDTQQYEQTFLTTIFSSSIKWPVSIKVDDISANYGYMD